MTLNMVSSVYNMVSVYSDFQNVKYLAFYLLRLFERNILQIT